MKVHQLFPLLINFCNLKSDLFFGKMLLHRKTLKIKGKVGNFTVLERVNIIPLLNDNSTLTLALKIANPLF